MGWRPVEWVWRVLPEAKFEKSAPCSLIFWIWATVTEISVKNSVWGPVEWVGDQLNGWGGSYQKQNFKKMHLVFWNFWIWATVVEISVKKQGLGTSWMGWGPVDWVGRVLPEPKFEKKCTSFFEIFGFERPLLRYLLKTVLHCKGAGIWLDAITQVKWG